MKNVKKFLTIVLFFSISGAYAQSVTIGDKEFDAHPAAILEMQSTSKGVLIPRLTLEQRNSMPVDALSTGLLIYQTNHSPGFYFYDGAFWRSLSAPDVVLETFAKVATSGSYEDLKDKPDLFSGDYEDLVNKPKLFSGEYADLTGVPEVFDSNYFALKHRPNIKDTVLKYASFETFDNDYLSLSNLPNIQDSVVVHGFDGDYQSLTNKPDLFSGAYGDLKDKPDLFSGEYGDLKDKPDLFSGVYGDLKDKPDLFSGAYGDLKDKPDLFSGEYGDLKDKPDLFSGEYGDLKNKPDLFSGDYEDLVNKPNLFSGEYADLTGVPAVFDSNYFALRNLPDIRDSIAVHGFDGDYLALRNLPDIRDSIAVHGFDGDYQRLTNVPLYNDSMAKHITAHDVNPANHADIRERLTSLQKEITDLFELLDGKTNTEHSHTRTDITDFEHIHARADITDFSHAHTQEDLPPYPTLASLNGVANDDARLSDARSASDVSPWAKQPDKPVYTATDVGLGSVANERQYSAQNPPPYPVTSVNGRIGAVEGLAEATHAAMSARPNNTTQFLRADGQWAQPPNDNTIYTHPTYTATNTLLTGANVYSNINVDATGHVTNLTTRVLTPTDIGAATADHTHDEFEELQNNFNALKDAVIPQLPREFGCIGFGSTFTSIGTAHFASNQMWTVGDQTWSDAVVATGCNKTGFYGGTTADNNFFVDCRNSDGNDNFGGHYFSGCALIMYRNILCPAPWRVPTAEDFCRLDMALNGRSDCDYRVSTEDFANYASNWGVSSFTHSILDMSSNNSRYWSSTLHSPKTLFIINFFASSMVTPQALANMNNGLALRCVR